MRTLKKFLLLLICLLVTACAYTKQSGMREDFEKQMKDYNRMLRWQEMEHAGMLYLAPDLREAFMKGAESARKRGITITDYRILTSECTPEGNKATAVVLFEYYTLHSNRIKSLSYYQDWINDDTTEKKGWRLKSQLPSFE
jgi:hypothetical protein